ncbi:hypothetical protein ACHAPT_004577 [Fusarium lateritium]
MSNEIHDAGQLANPGEDTCILKVKDCFPDICEEYLHTIAAPRAYKAEEVIHFILQQQESGVSYPIEKREVTHGEGDGKEDKLVQNYLRQYVSPERPQVAVGDPRFIIAKKMLAGDWRVVPIDFIVQILSGNGGMLFAAYVQIETAVAKNVAAGGRPPDGKHREPCDLPVPPLRRGVPNG